MTSNENLNRRSFLASAPLVASSTPSTLDRLVDCVESLSSRTFEIIATEEGDVFYEFVVAGEAEKTETSDRVGAGSNDVIVSGNSPVIDYVRGFTGNTGYGDAYEIKGSIRDFSTYLPMGSPADFELYVDGDRVYERQLRTHGEPFGPSYLWQTDSWASGVLEVVTTEHTEFFYEFGVEGDAEKAETSDQIAAGSNDVLIPSRDESMIHVRGFTGNPGYGDAYEIEGYVMYFRQTDDSDYFLRLNGRRITPVDLGAFPRSDG